MGADMVRIVFGEQVGKKTVTFHSAVQLTVPQAKALAEDLLRRQRRGSRPAGCSTRSGGNPVAIHDLLSRKAGRSGEI